METLGPEEPSLQEYDPIEQTGWNEVAVGTQAEMEKLGKKMKKKNPGFRYRITNFMSFVTWKSD